MKLLHRIGTARRMVRSRLRRRQALRGWAEYTRRNPNPERQPTEVAVYFADSKVNMYQIRQWYEPLQRLSEQHPVTIITRSATVALKLVEETSIEVVFHRTMAGVEQWLGKQRVGVVLYVNQNTRNFQMMRFHIPAHIHISHGESEKISMVSNQLKAYDYAFVAGQASVDRIQKRLINAPDDDRLRIVGRPQLDIAPKDLALPAGQTVILYAPTWEGDRPAMGYSSILSHGAALIQAATADPTVSVIYRPHPRTGVVNPAYRDASNAIKEQLEALNAAVGSQRHIVDDGPEFGWQLHAADVVIADISSVTYDALATRKPLLLTPPNEDAEELESMILADATYFEAHDVPQILNIIADPEAAQYCRVSEELLDYYYAGKEPGAALKLFMDAVDEIWHLREPYFQPITDPDAELDEDIFTDEDQVSLAEPVVEIPNA